MEKHVFLLAIALLLGSVFFITCKRDSYQNFSPNIEIKDKVNTWLDKQKSISPPAKATNINLLKENLEFSNLWYEELNSKERVMVIPINEDFKTKKKLDSKTIPVLFLVLDLSKNIIRGNIVLYTPENEQSYGHLAKNSFFRLYNSKPLDNDGKFRFLKITGSMLYEYGIKNGKLHSFGVLEKRKPASNSESVSKGDSEICLDWYLVTTYYDGNGNYLYETWEYLGTTCGCVQNGEPVTVIEDSCDGSGGGGGGGGTCCITDPNAQITINSVSETISDNCGLEMTNKLGVTTKTCTHTWTFCTNSLLWYTWEYRSVEQAVEQKQGSGWIFNSVTHQGVALNGTVPPCVNSSVSISSATPSFSGSAARMDLYYTISISIPCLGTGGLMSSSDQAGTHWNAL